MHTFLHVSCNLETNVFYKLILFFYFRGVYPPAEEYVNHADKSHITLVEAFRNMQVEEEEQPLENGDSNHEVYEI